MACGIFYGDGPMTAAQLFTFIKLRYADMRAYYLKEKDIVVIPVYEGMDEELDSIKELSARKGLYCSEVNASWPEYVSDEILCTEAASDFLVVMDIRGKYLQPGPC